MPSKTLLGIYTYSENRKQSFAHGFHVWRKWKTKLCSEFLPIVKIENTTLLSVFTYDENGKPSFARHFHVW